MTKFLKMLDEPSENGQQSDVSSSAPQPSVARMYDFYLGGTKSHATDRNAVAEVQKAMPDIFNIVQENRSFLRRCIRYMIRQGITQFIDIGSGIPKAPNTHEVAQSINPMAKVVYVDMDQAVLEHRAELLTANNTTAIIRADIRKPEDVFSHPELTSLIDLSKPVGILMMCVTCFLTDTEITQIMSTIRSTICEGSYIAVTQDTLDAHEGAKDNIARVQEVYNRTSIPLCFRSHKEVCKFFEGLLLVEPGVVFLNDWHPELDLPADAVKWLYGGVARKSLPEPLDLSQARPLVDVDRLRGIFLATNVLGSALIFVFGLVLNCVLGILQSKLEGECSCAIE